MFHDLKLKMVQTTAYSLISQIGTRNSQMRFRANSRDQKLPSLAKIVKESKEYYIFHEEGKERTSVGSRKMTV